MLVIFGGLLLVAVLLSAKWFLTNDRQSLITFARYALLGMGVVGLVLLLASGRISALLTGLLALLPLGEFFLRISASSFKSFHQGHEWGQQYSDPQNHHKMTMEQAQAILGLDTKDLTPEAVRAAHKSLIQKVHPDKGGSAYLSQEINEAREILLQMLKEE